MSLTVTLIVLLAAFLHAGWNFLVKRSGDKLLSMSAMVFGHVPFALLALLFVSLPSADAWGYILGSAVFHTGYQWFLLNAYHIGDLSQVYPLARGVAPLLVTLVSVGLLGVVLSVPELLAVVFIGGGIIALSLLRQGNGVFNYQAALLALMTGGFIAGYSLVDGLGARVSASPVGYYALGSCLNAAIWLVYVSFRRPGLLRELLSCEWKLSLQAGGASFSAYSMVVWAFTVAPIALVTALRETSILFAMLLGVLLLGEHMNGKKVMAVGVVLGGIMMLRISQV
ncbi:MAG: EamA family transporter [Thiolinea sp.]